MIVARQHDSGCHHRTGEGTAAGFIDSRDMRKASSAEAVLMLEGAIHIDWGLPREREGHQAGEKHGVRVSSSQFDEPV